MKKRGKKQIEMQAELCKMKMNGMQVSFIDLDPVITDTMFMLDGVHLNREGNDRMSGRILTWMKQKDTRQVERNRK